MGGVVDSLFRDGSKGIANNAGVCALSVLSVLCLCWALELDAHTRQVNYSAVVCARVCQRDRGEAVVCASVPVPKGMRRGGGVCASVPVSKGTEERQGGPDSAGMPQHPTSYYAPLVQCTSTCHKQNHLLFM